MPRIKPLTLLARHDREGWALDVLTAIAKQRGQTGVFPLSTKKFKTSLRCFSRLVRLKGA